MKTKIILSVLLLVCIILSSVPAFAEDSVMNNTSDNADMSEVSYRMQTLIDQLNGLTAKDIANTLAKYKDMKTKSNESKNAIGKLTALGIVGGGSSGNFNPDGNMNIDVFIKLVVKVLGFKPDVNSKDGTAEFIEIAIKNKVLDSKDFSGKYSRPITREEAAKIIVMAASLKDKAPDRSNTEVVTRIIRDYYSIVDKYKQFVVDSYLLGLFSNNAGATFDPKVRFTRGDICILLVKLLDVKERKPFKLDASTNAIEIDGSIVFPNGKLGIESINTAYVLRDNLSKSKGFEKLFYSDYTKVISCAFYNEEDDYAYNRLNNLEGFFDIKLNDNVQQQYVFTAYNAKAVKEKHREILKKAFNEIFGTDSKKAIAQLDKYLNIGATGSFKFTKEEFKKSEYYNYKKKSKDDETWITDDGNGNYIILTNNYMKAFNDTFVFNKKHVKFMKGATNSAFTIWIYRN